MLLQEGQLPLHNNALARSIGVSAPLLYTYFPAQTDIFNTALEMRLRELLDARAGGKRRATLKAAAIALARTYLDHIIAHGPVVQYILRDGYMAGAFSPAVQRLRHALTAPLILRLSRRLRLPVKDAATALNLLVAIPEELGTIVYKGELTPEQAREFCDDIVSSSIDGLISVRPRK